VIRAGGVRHVIVYHPDRLMRQPRDLEELLTLSDEHDITLHGQANRRDLSDPDDRFFLRIEVAHACRFSDDTSRRLRDALEDRAREGRPHTSAHRPYGYAADARTVIEAEAQMIREIFARYLDGVTPREIAVELNERGQPTVGGGLWQSSTVRRTLRSRHVTGIQIFRAQEFGEGIGQRSSIGACGQKPRTVLPTGPQHMRLGRTGFMCCVGWWSARNAVRR
jgi:site-specific DNA recombinase